MPTSTSSDLTRIFEEYQKERYPAVMESYNNSRFVAKVSDRGIIGRIVLYLITHMPMWLWRLAVSSLLLLFVLVTVAFVPCCFGPFVVFVTFAVVAIVYSIVD